MGAPLARGPPVPGAKCWGLLYGTTKNNTTLKIYATDDKPSFISILTLDNSEYDLLSKEPKTACDLNSSTKDQPGKNSDLKNRRYSFARESFRHYDNKQKGQRIEYLKSIFEK